MQIMGTGLHAHGDAAVKGWKQQVRIRGSSVRIIKTYHAICHGQNPSHEMTVPVALADPDSADLDAAGRSNAADQRPRHICQNEG